MRLIARPLAHSLLRLLLRAVVEFCLRHGLRLQDLIEAAKLQFVESARELLADNHPPRSSHIAAMTGVHRRDIARLISPDTAEFSYEKDLVTKVMGLWQTNRNFLTMDGAPKVLTFEGKRSEFSRLVGLVSKDLKPPSVLFELERSGAIERRPKGIALIRGSFVPRGDPEEGFKILAQDGNDFTRAVEENVFTAPKLPNLHARTTFDNIRPAGLEAIRLWMLREGHLLHLRAREMFGQYDQDINPDPSFSGPGARVVITSFGFVASPSTTTQEQEKTMEQQSQ